MQKSVSVIVLTFGDYSRLEQTLKSILCQTYPIQKIIVSDDGSGHPFPAELYRSFMRQDRLSFRQNERNLGTVAHMNRVSALTDSDYIKFISSGDALSDPGALESLICFAEQSDSMIIASQAMVCDADLRQRMYQFPGKYRGRAFSRTAAELYRMLAVQNLVAAAGILFHRRFFTRWGFDEEYTLLEDWPAWLRITREGEAIPFLDRTTCLYAVGGVSSKELDAFCSQALRSDMLRCYEKEILPYLGRFSPAQAKRILYGYDQLRGTSPGELLKQYFLLELRTRLKRRIKRCALQNLP